MLPGRYSAAMSDSPHTDAPMLAAARPADEAASKVAAVCRFIVHAERPPTLAQLAAHVGLSTFHLHRVFKAHTGLTPRAYAAAERARRVREGLAHGEPVTQAMYGAGYQSSGRFYEEASQVLGMKPSDFRAGGRRQVIRFAVGPCALGEILVAASERGVCAILMGDDAESLLRDLQDRFPAATLMGGDASFEQWVAQVVGFVEAPALGLRLPLDIRGTAFQQRVWQALQAIPAGQTASYSEVAERIGAPKAVRAVASACAANALAVAIPCHRVVRQDGSLSGYRWGIERKRALLACERAQADGAAGHPPPGLEGS
jgi:AraC family transcriptional regulator of adaptative response/methylated-DNA-[protein]-cysteine methyltransferase